MASETDQNSQRLLRTTKLRFFLSWQKVAWIKFTESALLNTVGLNNMIHFGLRGCKEPWKELRWVDTVLKTESDGKEYLEYFEGQKKTRTGEDPRNQRPIKPRMYANNDAISIERIVIQCTFARCTTYKENEHQGGLATAFELATFRLSMIALVKKSVNHSRTAANMPRTGWEQQQQQVRVRSDSVKWIRFCSRWSLFSLPQPIFVLGNVELTFSFLLVLRLSLHAVYYAKK